MAAALVAASATFQVAAQFAPVDSLLVESGQGGFSGQLDAGDRFGRSAIGMGDLNGDGVPDMVVGARSDDDGGPANQLGWDAGALWICFLNRDGTVQSQQKVSSTAGGFGTGLDSVDWFGYSLASIGDLDGDGVLDLAVGAPGDDDGATNAGALWILFLNSNGTVKARSKISNTQGGLGNVIGARSAFGQAAGPLGDYDGDGIPDVAVGAPGDDDGGVDRGAVWILLLNRNGTVKTQSKISSTAGGFGAGLSNGDGFGGRHVVNLGDLDGDGRGEIAVGAFRADDGGLDRGALWILFLSSANAVIRKQKISDTTGGLQAPLDDDDLFGMTVSPIGDVDGDGVPDCVVGNNKDDDGGADKGALFFLLLNRDGTVKQERKVSATSGGYSLGLRNGERFGRAMGTLGDVRGDGSLAIVAGAGAGIGGGSVYIVFFAPLAADRATVSLATGGTQRLTIDAGPDQAGKVYGVLGSITGTTPGVQFGSLTVPLAFDGYFSFMLDSPNTLVQGSLGVLGAGGTAIADVVIPSGVSASFIGTKMYHAFLTFDPSTSSFDFVSNATVLELVQ